VISWLRVATASGSTFSDTLTGIEDVTGSTHDDMLSGNLAANVLDGQAGDDTLDVQDGISGNDSAIGGSGFDTCLADARDRRKTCEA